MYTINNYENVNELIRMLIDTQSIHMIVHETSYAIGEQQKRMYVIKKK